jgi:hypothetical protein
MRSIITSVLLGVGALGISAVTPAQSQASWLSRAVHRRYDPAYYGPNYYAPGYAYYDGPVYYDTYPVPYGGYYYGPRNYRYWDGDRRERHEWQEHHDRDGRHHR